MRSSIDLLFRRYGGRIFDEKTIRSSTIDALSRTRGWLTSRMPAPVAISRVGR
jgi:hypothetical protein